MDKMTFKPFRESLLKVLSETNTDEELKAEIRKLISDRVDKEVPYIMRPVKAVNKTVH